MHPSYSLHPNLELMTHERRLLHDLMGEPFGRRRVADDVQPDVPGRDRLSMAVARAAVGVRQRLVVRDASPVPA